MRNDMQVTPKFNSACATANAIHGAEPSLRIASGNSGGHRLNALEARDLPKRWAQGGDAGFVARSEGMLERVRMRNTPRTSGFQGLPSSVYPAGPFHIGVAVQAFTRKYASDTPPEVHAPAFSGIAIAIAARRETFREAVFLCSHADGG